jgi:DME family drug/metabolite transporter
VSGARPGVSPAVAGMALVAAAAVLWGSSAAAVRLFTDETGASGVVIAFAEALIAAPLLLAAGAATRGAWPPLRRAAPAALGTGVLVSGFLVAYFTAIGTVGVTIASVIAICSAPLFTAVLAGILLRERPSRATTVALGAGVVGTALVLLSHGDSGAGGEDRLGGVLLSLLAGLCFGGENVLVRRLVARIDPTQLAALTTCTMVLLLAPPALAQGGVLSDSIQGWPWLVYLAVFPTAMAPALHNAGLRRVPAIPASIVGLVEPLTATTLGIVVFDEAVGPAGIAGAALLLGALVLLSLSQRAPSEARSLTAEPARSLEGST